VVSIHDNGSVALVLEQATWDELLDPEKTGERFVVASCFFHHELLPGFLFPLFETRSTSMLVHSWGPTPDPDSMEHYKRVAADYLSLDPVGRRFRPEQPRMLTIAWIPMLIFIVLFSIWWWLSAVFGKWLAHIDLHLREICIQQPCRLRGECEHCGYPCAGHGSAVCPQCGRAVRSTAGA